MILWKKEFDDKNACYINILPADNQARLLAKVFENRSCKEKSDGKSTELRTIGNIKFKANLCAEAMELYNQSLRFAPKDSENISLAYANRSACFLKLQMHEQCLFDIELAKKANYPQQSMPKLVERKKMCLKMLKFQSQTKVDAKPTLSVDADENFSCLANVLEIQNNEEFGKHIVAKSDIEVGQVILLEKVFAFGVACEDRVCCDNCLKFAKNFIPCPNCNRGMFCDELCMESNKIHKIDCGASHHYMTAYEKLLIKMVLIAVELFQHVDKLMKFVENALATRDFDSSIDGSSEQLNYGLFLKLFASFKELHSDSRNEHFIAYQKLLEIPIVKQRFDTKQKQRFLMHFVGQHLVIVQTNNYTFASKNVPSICTIANFPSLFNHSCTPNVFIIMCNDQQIGITIHPVKKGSQLLVGGSTRAFKCKCSRCIPCYRPDDRLKMMRDPNTDFIIQNGRIFLNDHKKCIELKEKCRQFLNKYGHLPWTIEIEIVSRTFEECLNKEYRKF